MRACSWPSGPIATTITSPASTRFCKGKRFESARHGQQVEPVCRDEMVTHRDVLNPGAVHGLPLAFDPVESKNSWHQDMRKNVIFASAGPIAPTRDGGWPRPSIAGQLALVRPHPGGC